MNKCALVLGAVAVVTFAGCKDPDYKSDNGQSAQNQVKPVEETPAPAQPIAIEAVPVAKCTCAPGTKHTSPCTCGAPDCRCIVEPQKVIVADVKPQPQAPAVATTTYVVQRGDSLSKISKKYNIRIDALRRANPKLKGDVVRIGQKLTLPGQVDVGVQTVPAGAFAKPLPRAAKKPYAPYAGATKEYVVKNGDTLGAIAYSNGVSIRQLKELNGLSSNMVRIGQKLKVPASGKLAAKNAGAKPTAKPAAKAAAKAAAKPVAKAKAEASAPAEAPKPEEPAAEQATAPSASDVESALKDVEKEPAADANPAPEAPAEKAPEAQAQKQPEVPTTNYIVQEGDDMTGVSIRWAVSAARIRELNNLADDAQLMPGQVLKIPVEGQQ